MNFEVIFDSVSSSLSTLLIVVIIIISISAVLIILELMLKKKHHREISAHSPEEDKIRKLIDAKLNSKRKIEQLSEVSKSIFKEKFNFSQKESYSELLEDFKKINNQLGIKFCILMSDFYYSPKKPAPEKIRTAIALLSAIVKGREKSGKEHLSESDTKNSKIHHELEKIFSLKKEIDSLIKQWRAHKLIPELEKEESKEKAMALISKNQEDYAELKKLVSGIKRKHAEFNSILSQVYEMRSLANRKIKKLVKSWKKENARIMKSSRNPFKYYSECLNLFDKHLTNLGIILTKEISR